MLVLLPLELLTGYLRGTTAILASAVEGFGGFEYESPLRGVLAAAMAPVRAPGRFAPRQPGRSGGISHRGEHGADLHGTPVAGEGHALGVSGLYLLEAVFELSAFGGVLLCECLAVNLGQSTRRVQALALLRVFRTELLAAGFGCCERVQ